jgi:lipopolysaccharide biosynthesis glycosyltransferase
MDIIYTCDNNYVFIMGISMISLFETNKSADKIHIHLLGHLVSNENVKMLSEIAEKYGRQFSAIDVPLLNIPDVLYSQRWPESAYTRLFLGELMPEEMKKALYLDCDTIITDDISELWKMDVSGYTIYGVKDCIGKAYKENIGLDRNAVYVNAGVLIINLEKLRKINIGESIGMFLNTYAKRMNYSDQDLLNGVFHGNFGVLNAKYDVMTLQYAYDYDEIRKIRHPTNYYSKEEFIESKTHPAIVHFTTCMLAIRPWFEGSKHPYTEKFDRYKEMSPWANSAKTTTDFVSIEGKILKVILKLPKEICLPIIGVMHAVLKPYQIRLRALM